MTSTSLAGPVSSEQHRLYRRTLGVVVLSQVFGGAGLAAGVTVGALIAEDMLGVESVAGLPAALFTLGSALAAFTIGRVSQRRGRRIGLAAGFLTGAAGAVGIIVAAVLQSPWLLFPAMFVYGSGTATNLQARYAGTDLATPQRRATAVSIAMVATTLGAVVGPNTVNQLDALAVSLGLPQLTGPFLLAGVAYATAGSVLLVLLRPDPLLTARELAAAHAATGSQSSVDVALTDGAEEPEAGAAGSPRGVALGATIMVLTQIAMVAIMTMTPVYMRAHHHGLSDVGLVISLHIAAMYLPSLLTGPLVDRWGRVPMAISAAVTLLAAGLVGALGPEDSMLFVSLSLMLLGLGWNFGVISGTALIVDSTTAENHASTQGSIDVLIALSGASGAAMSGVVMGMTSYATLAMSGGFLALLLIPVVVWQRQGTRALAH